MITAIIILISLIGATVGLTMMLLSVVRIIDMSTGDKYRHLNDDFWKFWKV